ncbi:efflux RND transporter periplasmic adaptor subunit [Nitrosomonas sp. Nm33]|uniref:efflux RND transporter periplasmic adaptor subunit n=1 Tax=Nitrosomonas sp. Nm33 TaxID=133724 RepID=UPI00089BDD7C|nr:efflux RND transporter periplasmic adaptor subunit [Nitrosomonas sp. Nm33]SDY45151.1 HlyD family secretion protein [Nitrosomonas sp. Nm33]
MQKTKILSRWLILLFMTALLSYAGWYLTRKPPVEVEVATITRGTVEATVVNTRAGTIKACRRAKLAPAVGGQIVKLPVNEGDRVKQGDVLLKLWNADLVAQHELAKRQLATAKSRQREACIMAENAQREFIRTQQLVAQGFVSSQRADEAEANAQSRQANCAALAADVKRAQAQIEVIQANLDRTTLYAPFAGIIARLTGELGEYTMPSPPGIPTPPVIDLIDDSCLYVSAPMDEVDTPKIKIGQEARITLDALPGQTFAGTVHRIAPYVTEIEKQARTVDIEVYFTEGSNYALLAGYSADVEVIINRHEQVLRIPTQAIRQRDKVLVLDQHDRIEERTIKTGLANWAFTEIISGLKEGEQVLTSFDNEGIAAGVIVKPKTSQS